MRNYYSFELYMTLDSEYVYIDFFTSWKLNIIYIICNSISFLRMSTLAFIKSVCRHCPTTKNH